MEMKSEIENRSGPTQAMADAGTSSQAKRFKALELWHRLTAPAEPHETVPLPVREAARRGRLASTTMLFMSIVNILPIPIAFITHNPVLLITLLVTLAANGTSLVFNRLGKQKTAGILFITVLNGGLFYSLLLPPGGLGIANLPVFDILIESILVAVAFFPAWSVFPIAAINCLFLLGDLTLGYRTPELVQYLTINIYSALIRPMILQIIVATITYLWVQSATRAITRADRAEELARAAQTLSLQAELLVKQKEELDSGVQQILQALAPASRGDFSSRIPQTKNNILWQIVYVINNLLARLQSASQSEQLLQQAQQENLKLREINQRLILALRQRESGKSA
jgi:large-conductance mechanosensitive channel